MRRVGAGACAIMLVALLPAAGCKSGAREDEGGAEAAGPKQVRCEAAEAAQVSDEVRLRGTIAPLPDRDAQVAPQVSGRILTLLAREGDRVTAGQVVAKIDDAPLLDEAKAAEAALARVKAENQNAQTTLERVKRVFEHGIAARQEVDDANARAASAAAAEAEAEAAAARARRQVERATVKSPLLGVVVKLFRKPGELVDGTPATPVLEVADPSRLELVADSPAADLVRLQQGQRAAVTVPALPGARWEGSVAAVSPAVDRATGLGVARVALELGEADAGAVLRPPIGTLGLAEVKLGEPRTATLVPLRALRASTGEQAEVVVCGADFKAHVRVVVRGANVEGRVIVEGVKPGERVAVEPVLGLAEGDPLAQAGAEDGG